MLLLILNTEDLKEMENIIESQCVQIIKFDKSKYSKNNNLIGIDYFIYSHFYDFSDKSEIARYLKNFYSPEILNVELLNKIHKFCDREGIFTPYELDVNDWEIFISENDISHIEFPENLNINNLNNKILVFDEYELSQDLVNILSPYIEECITDY